MAGAAVLIRARSFDAMAIDRPAHARRPLPRWLREPTVHFFVVAAAALLVHRLVAGDERTISLPPALRADLLRRYGDQLSRAPTSAEAEAFLAAWKSDEALYREALAEGLDRDDPAVRNLLVGKMKERLLLQSRIPEPSETELKLYLEQHRDEFEEPLSFEHDYVTLAKGRSAMERERHDYLSRLRAGSTPAALGLRTTAANVSRERIAQDFGPAVAEAIVRLPVGQWDEVELADGWLLVKLLHVAGGLPPPDELRGRLTAAWKAERAARALSEAARSVVNRYHFEESPR